MSDDQAGREAPVIDTPAGWHAAVVWGVETALARGARRITFADPDFETWPLDDPTLLQGLGGWLRLPQRRLTLLARDYDEVPRRFPRFSAWRRNFGHAVECRQAPQDLAADVPSVLVDDGAVSVHLVDAVHWRGRAAVNPRTATLLRERIDVVLQRSEPGFAVDTLGL